MKVAVPFSMSRDFVRLFFSGLTALSLAATAGCATGSHAGYGAAGLVRDLSLLSNRNSPIDDVERASFEERFRSSPGVTVESMPHGFSVSFNAASCVPFTGAIGQFYASESMPSQNYMAYRPYADIVLTPADNGQCLKRLQYIVQQKKWGESQFFHDLDWAGQTIDGVAFVNVLRLFRDTGAVVPDDLRGKLTERTSIPSAKVIWASWIGGGDGQVAGLDMLLDAGGGSCIPRSQLVRLQNDYLGAEESGYAESPVANVYALDHSRVTAFSSPMRPDCVGRLVILRQ